MTLALGDRVGEMTFLRGDSTSARLSELVPGVAVLVFLRHLG
jgi:hypothetical protein